MRLTISRLFILFLCLHTFHAASQTSGIQYQDLNSNPDAKVGFGMYGRVGMGWNFGTEGNIARRLNLNNMGSIGGRMEEQDYLEFGSTYKFKPIGEDSTIVRIQLRGAVYSQGQSLFANSSTSSILGLTLALPEIFVEVRNAFTKDLSFWIGNRLYRGPDIHLADYFGFNDRSGQAFGMEYKNSLLHINFVSSTDTNADFPPYFYVSTATGTPSLQLRERVVVTLEHNFVWQNETVLTAMGEYHDMPGPDEYDPLDSLNLPGAVGWVIGGRLTNPIQSPMPGSFNSFSARFGSGIANGGNGGSSKTYLTYGAPNPDTYKFDKGAGIEITNHFLYNFSRNFSLNGYGIYHYNKGAATTNGKSPTYFNDPTFNRKSDLTFGVRGTNYISDMFHILSEIDYSQRKDGDQDRYSMVKFMIAPTLSPKKDRSVWARPHLRLVASLARYNDLAMQDSYSPYLEVTGPKRWGHYFGFKAEWWTW